jgi:ParB family chromosome partitioning protein
MAKLERVAAFKISPSSLKIIGVDKYDASHPLYDARVTREVQPELVSAVAEFGVLKPVIVSKEDVTGDYLVVDGRQRVRAARLANEKRAEKGADPIEVPFIVREGDVASLLAVAAAANVNMEETMLDRALRVDHMIKQGMKRSAIATSFGVSEMAISNWLKLLKVDNQVLSALAQGAIGATTALKFAALPADKQVSALHEAVPALKPNEATASAATETAAAPAGTETLAASPAAAAEPQKVSGRSAASAIAAVATEEPTFIAPTIGELKRVYSVTFKRLTDAAKKEGTKAKLPSWMAVLRFIVEGKEEAAPDLAAAVKMLRAAKASKEESSESEEGDAPAAAEPKAKKEKVAKVTDAEKASALEKIKAQAAAARAAAAAVQPLTPTVGGVPVGDDSDDESDDE